MEWEHKCSLEWLKARQDYLTASEIRVLLPYTKTGRPRTITEMDYLKVMSSKLVTLSEEDCISHGAAARGHLLEPWAVEALNNALIEYNGPVNATYFHWWDDKLVMLPDRDIAFSPDALDMSQKDMPVVVDATDMPITALAEVKCYGTERHIITAYTEKDQLEERWQIATAMALLDTIEHAYLVLFNPSMISRRLFVIEFKRHELDKEIDAILDVEQKWSKFVDDDRMSSILPHDYRFWSSMTLDEEEIIKTEERRRHLNP